MAGPMDGFKFTTLANVAGGALEEEFQRALVEVGQIFEEHHEFETDKDDAVRTKIVLEIDMTKQASQATVSLDVRSIVKRPKRKRQGHTGFYAAGAFSEAAFSQVPLPLAPSRTKAPTIPNPQTQPTE